MTTVVYDGKELACDSLCTNDGIVVEREGVKIWRLKNGELFGAAGTVEEIIEAKAWIEAGSPEASRPKFDDFQAIRVDTFGVGWYCEGKMYWRRRGKQIVIGTGSDYARAALHLGLSARKAVELAINFDVYSGGRVRTLRFRQVKHRLAA